MEKKLNYFYNNSGCKKARKTWTCFLSIQIKNLSCNMFCSHSFLRNMKLQEIVTFIFVRHIGMSHLLQHIIRVWPIRPNLHRFFLSVGWGQCPTSLYRVSGNGSCLSGPLFGTAGAGDLLSFGLPDLFFCSVVVPIAHINLAMHCWNWNNWLRIAILYLCQNVNISINHRDEVLRWNVLMTLEHTSIMIQFTQTT